jgi:hypothetical protein
MERQKLGQRCGPGRVWACVAAASLALGASVAAFAGDKHTKKPEADQPGRPLSIPVADLGFGLIPPHFVSPLSTMFTVNFVDDRHLLFTFNERALLKRLPDATDEDDDRSVAAVLLELPTGKVLARTSWRTRDRDRYLWPLGHGRFLLRVRSHLSVIDPLVRLAQGGPDAAFHQEPFLEIKRTIGYIAVSPGGDLLGIETLPPRRGKLLGVSADAKALAAAMEGTSDAAPVEIVEEPKRPPVEIYFFRLQPQGSASHELLVQNAGMVGARSMIELPATAEGYVDVKRENPQLWDLDFVSHIGKRQELAAYETSCAPRPFFVSRGEFVALGCHGAPEKPELSYFNLKGEEPWISVLSGPHVSPQIVAAPDAGRFALSRVLVNQSAWDADNITFDDMVSQEIEVIQNASGRSLLKVQATPIERAGQNFDLSPSGLRFAVLRGTNLEVYRLPELSGEDHKAIETAKRLAPEANDAPVRLNSIPVNIAEDAKPAPPPVAKPVAQSGLAALPASESPSAAAASTPVSTEGANGDQDGPARKKPSLYGPDEKPR